MTTRLEFLYVGYGDCTFCEIEETAIYDVCEVTECSYSCMSCARDLKNFTPNGMLCQGHKEEVEELSVELWHLLLFVRRTLLADLIIL